MRKRRVWRRFNAHVAQLRLFRVREETDWRPEDTPDDPEDGSVGDDSIAAEDGATDECFPDSEERQSGHSSIEPSVSIPLASRFGREIRRPHRFTDFVSS